MSQMNSKLKACDCGHVCPGVNVMFLESHSYVCILNNQNAETRLSQNHTCSQTQLAPWPAHSTLTNFITFSTELCLSFLHDFASSVLSSLLSCRSLALNSPTIL